MGVFSVVRLKKLFWMVAICSVLVVVGTCACALGVAMAHDRILPIYCVQDERKIAITFDAAWGADKTKAIVDTLCRYNIQGTFFLTGFWIDAYPAETLYIHEKGMQIGNHSANHYNMGKMNADRCFAEIASVNTQLYQMGISPRVFRAPFGDYGNTLMQTLQSMSMRCIQWDVDSLDWKGLSAAELTKRVVEKCQAGSIILCHNNSDHIVEALPSIIEGLQAKGYVFVTIDALLQGKEGKIDHTGRLMA